MSIDYYHTHKIFWLILLQDFITRLLRRDPGRRMSASDCSKHPWLGEKDGAKKTGKIKIENLRKFLARRKVQNVGKVLKAINVFKVTARDSESRLNIPKILY